MRCALGAVTLTLIAKSKKVSLPRERVVWGHLLVVAMLINVIPGILFAVAETHCTSILAGIINGMVPLTSLFFITLVFRDEEITRAKATGLVTGLLGVLCVFGVWEGLGSNPWWAVAALLFSVTLYGISYPYSRRHLTPRGIAPASLATAQLLLASAVLLPTFIVLGPKGNAPTLKAALAISCLGIFGSGFAFMWNFQVIGAAGSAIASTMTYITPVVAVFMGVIFLHEPLRWFEPLGGLLVLLGAAIGQGRIRLGRR